MQDLSVKHRYPSLAAGLNLLAPGLGFYYLAQRREAWLSLLLVMLPLFMLLVFPPRPAPISALLLLLSVALWLITTLISWRRAGKMGPMIQHEFQRWYRYLLFWLSAAGLMMLWLFLLLVVKWQLSLHQITDNHMAGTFDKHDWVVIDSRHRQADDFSRGDIVLMLHPETGDAILQRVVALPGEQVTVHAGGLFIDGEWQRELYLDDLRNQQGLPEGVVETTVAPAQLFVLADNRDHSRDSRYWGSLPADRILGRQIYRLGDSLWRDSELRPFLEGLSWVPVGD